MSLGGWRGLALTLLIAPLLAACAVSHSSHRRAFTSAEYGVAVSPRVTTAKYPPRGGGRVMAGDSYMVRGVVYRPVAGPGYVATGEASWYGMDFHGRRTANGEIFGAYYLTMASPVLPSRATPASPISKTAAPCSCASMIVVPTCRAASPI